MPTSLASKSKVSTATAAALSYINSSLDGPFLLLPPWVTRGVLSTKPWAVFWKSSKSTLLLNMFFTNLYSCSRVKTKVATIMIVVNPGRLLNSAEFFVPRARMLTAEEGSKTGGGKTTGSCSTIFLGLTRGCCVGSFTGLATGATSSSISSKKPSCSSSKIVLSM